jgi:hypothetical protein
VSDWIEHDGGPQPVADDVWILPFYRNGEWYISGGLRAEACVWEDVAKYRILNQHLIDAARLEGIRLGLEAAAREAAKGSDRLDGEWREGCKTDNHLAGQSDGMDEAAALIRLLDPATIAREAVLDKLASEAQEQGMGYDRNVRYGVEVVRPPSAPLIAKEADQ